MTKNVKQVRISNFDVNCYLNIQHAVGDIITNRLGNSNVAVAINPEKIVSSARDARLNETLLKADVRYFDGIGAVLVGRYKSNEKIARIPGCELWEALMSAAGENDITVYLVGASEKVIREVQSILTTEFNVKVVGCRNGFFENDGDLINDILESGAQILTVGMGSPKQELFIDKCKKRGVTAFMMGIGGTYDVFTNAVVRAPYAWRKFGLEWLYRLIQDPSRLKRQVKLLEFFKLALLRKL